VASSIESAEDGLAPLSKVDYWLAHSAANYAAFWEHPARTMGMRWARWDDVWAADPQCPNPIPNGATLLRRLDATRADDMVARLSQFYAEKPGAPWVLWSAWPVPDLQRWGFELLGNVPLMVRLPGAALPAAPPELRIVEVTDATTIVDFERAFIDGFHLPELRPIRAGSLYDERVVGGQLRLWVGYLGDRPVTTAAALADNTVNGIYAVASLPEVRGRGYGTAVTARAVAAYLSLPAVLEATEQGYPIYMRLGFTEVAQYSLWLRQR
jgi:GNAT superfamily N-acetyltransferase